MKPGRDGQLHDGGAYASAQASPINDFDQMTPVAGLPGMAQIVTAQGIRPVQDLRPGDRIITRDAGMAALARIAHQRVTCARVRILSGALGHARPDHEIVLPAAQRLLLRDWRARALYGRAQVLVPAARLVDGQYVSALPPGPMTLYSLHFDADHVVYAEGLELSCPAMNIPAPTAPGNGTRANGG